MPLITKHVRGSEIEFSVGFNDADGVPIDPDAATLHLSFIDAAGARVTDEITMEADTAGAWNATWDSSVADNGRVYWAVRAVNPPAAQEGYFELTANRANPDAGTA